MDFSWITSDLVEDCLWRTSAVASKTSLRTVFCSTFMEEGFVFSADCSENLGSKQVSWPGWFLGFPERLVDVSARLVPGVSWEVDRCTGRAGPWGPLGGRQVKRAAPPEDCCSWVEACCYCELPQGFLRASLASQPLWAS